MVALWWAVVGHVSEAGLSGKSSCMTTLIARAKPVLKNMFCFQAFQHMYCRVPLRMGQPGACALLISAHIALVIFSQSLSALGRGP